MTRRFCLLALGSRGDVQPFVALGIGLRTRGHEVVIAAADDYRALVCDHGLEFAPLVGRIADRMDRVTVAASLDGGLLGSLRLALRLRADAAPLLDTLFADTLAATRGSDVLIASTLGLHIGYSVAEALGGLPVVAAHFHPYTPSRQYANLFFGEWPLRSGTRIAGLYHRLTHLLGVNGFWHLLQPLLNASRRRVLKLPPLNPLALERFLRKEQESGLQLYAYSSRLVPIPSDWNPERQIVTGYWHHPRPQTWTPPPEIQAFLDAGERPVYIGFGSILAGRDPDGMTCLLADALNQVGVRGILYRGWGDLGNIPLPPSLFVTDSVPHDWLFPHCAAVVHHGGAGTTAAGLRAGIPAVIVPVFGDQRFWARRLYEAGATPAPLPRNRLTAPRLADAITQTLTDPALHRQTQNLGAVIQAEDGVGKAISLLEP